MATATCTPRARDLFQMTSSAIFRDARGQSLQCQQRERLHLIVPQRFFAHSQQSNGDRHMYASRTRFIPDDILGNFQGCAWPVAAVPAKGEVLSSDPVDISARLRRMWKE